MQKSMIKKMSKFKIKTSMAGFSLWVAGSNKPAVLWLL